MDSPKTPFWTTVSPHDALLHLFGAETLRSPNSSHMPETQGPADHCAKRLVLQNCFELLFPLSLSFFSPAQCLQVDLQSPDLLQSPDTLKVHFKGRKMPFWTPPPKSGSKSQLECPKSPFFAHLIHPRWTLSDT